MVRKGSFAWATDPVSTNAVVHCFHAPLPKPCTRHHTHTPPHATHADAFVPGFKPMRAVRTAPLSSTATAPAVEEALATAANEARGLAMDSIAAAESGCVVVRVFPRVPRAPSDISWYEAQPASTHPRVHTHP